MKWKMTTSLNLLIITLAISMKTKICFKCNTEYGLEFFHKHKGMKDGHLNKCKYCVVKDVADWRKNNPEARKIEHARNRERKGFMTKAEYVAKTRENAIGRRVSSNKYSHKRRMRTEVPMTEWDEFVLEEAISLANERNKTTSTKWHVDHIVPLNHRKASGLHCANNLQVVPASWNLKKNNTNMNTWIYFENPHAGY